ncbi:hypothetical protein RHGRI_010525 [Rhododendron griersonianum]|uniref:Uncharacterized protein n=1 Tax=Rhododendron griersonianum TaxID=479676 RepID=A0AAV6KIX1_9ERIC|nr:hypothetical protein RHGRI_010525 [Rhododendron griersonianum]
MRKSWITTTRLAAAETSRRSAAAGFRRCTEASKEGWRCEGIWRTNLGWGEGRGNEGWGIHGSGYWSFGGGFGNRKGVWPGGGGVVDGDVVGGNEAGEAEELVEMAMHWEWHYYHFHLIIFGADTKATAKGAMAWILDNIGGIHR